jgi:hypothetical protein
MCGAAAIVPVLAVVALPPIPRSFLSALLPSGGPAEGAVVDGASGRGRCEATGEEGLRDAYGDKGCSGLEVPEVEAEAELLMDGEAAERGGAG